MQQNEGRRYKLRQRMMGPAGSEYIGSADHTEQEHLELLLTYTVRRGEVAPIARALLAEFGSAAGAVSAPKEKLLMVPGVSTATAAFFKLIANTAQMLSEAESEAEAPSENKEALPGTRLLSVREGAAYCISMLKEGREECLLLTLLGADSSVLASFYMAEGSGERVGLPSALIIENARLAGASGVVIAHNHPSGDIRPSEADVAATKRLAALLAQSGVRLYEHYIVAGSNCWAMLSELAFTM